MGRTVILMDNGSLEPAAVLALRAIAAALSTRIRVPVEPVSLLHSSAIPAGRLGGVPAEILEPALERRAALGVDSFDIVPLFFGPSLALTEYLPQRIDHLRSRFPKIDVRLAAPLYANGDARLAQILADNVRATAGNGAADAVAGGRRRVALVDHGSPARAVTAVRDALARQLADELGNAHIVAASSMEVRAGPEFAFARPLLGELLASPGWNSGEVIVAMQFLLPGRHAGPDGDVRRICRGAERANPGLFIRQTRLVGEHPVLIDVLEDRWRRLNPSGYVAPGRG